VAIGSIEGRRIQNADDVMPASAWRASALFWIALTLVLTLGDLVHLGSGGTYGATIKPVSLGRTEGIVSDVKPGSPAARAGLVNGDRVDPGPSLTDRVIFNSSVAPGMTMTLRVTHGSQTRMATMVAEPQERSPVSSVFGSVYELLRIVMLAVAFLIAVRQPNRPEARALATFYIAFAFGFLSRPPWYPVPVIIAIYVLRPIAVFFALTQALRFATLFPHPSSTGLRRFLERAGPYLFAASVLAVMLSFFGSEVVVTTADFAIDALFILILVAIVVAFALGFRSASQAERPRLQWVMVSLVVGLAGLLPTILLEQAGVDAWWVLIFPLTLLAIPLGTGYAILRHRLLDIGFVISRALVFATLSSIVVLSFTGLEWILTKTVVHFGHIQSIVLDAALALTLGFSMQRLHSRVDHTVDNLFFRERYRAQQALDRFARECTYIGDADVLTERTLDVLQRNTRAPGVSIYLRAHQGDYELRGTIGTAPESLDPDDPAIVQMRAFRVPVDLKDASRPMPAVPGLIAFPMLVRGELIGFFSLAVKPTGEAYDPDERAALSGLAAALAAAYETLDVQELKRALDRALAGDGSLDALRALRPRPS
jgi:hypothetical protein